MESRVELFAAIRRDARLEDLSIRELAESYRVHRRTVRQALASAMPPQRKAPVRTARVLEPFKPAIDAMLRADLDAPRKQRHTARRVLGPAGRRARRGRVVVLDGAGLRRETPAGDLGGGGPVAGGGVRAAGSRVRRRGRGRLRRSVGDPARGEDQDHTCSRCGCRRRARRCTGRSPPRARRRSWKATCTRSTELGGVPVRHIRYDNLKAAVSRVLSGRNRLESDRWVAFRSHYGFDAFYCQPGVDGAHEKGGVEGEGGRFRRTHCVPMPEVDSIAELNELLAACRRQGRAPPDRQPAPDRRPRLAAGAGVAAAAARRAVPDLADVDPAGRPVCPGHGPAGPVLGAGPADRPHRPGPAGRLHRHDLRRPTQVAAHERVSPAAASR